MLRAVLFDWGDTLMQYEWTPDIAVEGNRAALAALERADLPDVEAIEAWFADRDPELLVDYEDEVDLEELVRACLTHGGAPLSAQELRRYMDVSHGVWAASYHVPRESLALLDELRARGLKLGIVSNSATPLRYLTPTLERQGLAERVDTIVFSCEIGKRKPHPAIFERALAELGVAAADALFVGDRLYQDVLGAGRLGMTAVQALWFRADEHPKGREPDFRADTPGDVLRVVERLREAS